MGCGRQAGEHEQKGILFQLRQAQKRCNDFHVSEKFPTLTKALQNLAALHRKLYVLEYLGWYISMDSRQFVQLSQDEFNFVRQHRTSWPDARGGARADKSTTASAEELRAYLQATILPVDDNTQDPTAASSSEPQRLQAPWVNPTRQEWEHVVEPTNDHRYHADQWSDTSAIASAVAWPSD